jgi:DNA repair photolyase
MLVTEAKTQQPLILQKPGSFVGGFSYTLAAYAGCEFGCTYCYVPHVLKGLAQRRGGWGSYVDVRSRCVGLLLRQAHKLAGKSIFMSATTDPYQPAEAQMRLTRGLLEALADIPFSFLLISTRSGLVLRDLDIFTDPRMQSRVEIGLSIPSDIPGAHGDLEPCTSKFAGRFRVLQRLHATGVATRVHAAPLARHTPEFFHQASDCADWLWIDGTGHGARRSAAGEKWLYSYDAARFQAKRATELLGVDRVGFGRERFAWRWNRSMIVPQEVTVCS